MKKFLVGITFTTFSHEEIEAISAEQASWIFYKQHKESIDCYEDGSISIVVSTHEELSDTESKHSHRLFDVGVMNKIISDQLNIFFDKIIKELKE